MRKELLVFVDSGERGEEVSITSVVKNRDFVLINSGVGKFTISRSQLKEALAAIEEFDSTNESQQLPLIPNILVDVEYGNE